MRDLNETKKAYILKEDTMKKRLFVLLTLFAFGLSVMPTICSADMKADAKTMQANAEKKQRKLKKKPKKLLRK